VYHGKAISAFSILAPLRLADEMGHWQIGLTHLAQDVLGGMPRSITQIR